MKKILSIILMLSLAVTCAFAFASCGTCAHTDSDGDGKCDECDENYCAFHVDEDRDGICDREDCGSVVACASHIDVNNDGVCDTTGCYEPVACVAHVDNDNNSICDNPLCNAPIAGAEDSYETLVAPFVSALANKAKAIVVNVSVTKGGETLGAKYTFSGNVLHYEMDVVPGLDSDDTFIEGDVTVDANGTVVSGDASVYQKFAANDLTYNIASGITEYELAGNILMIKVEAANTEVVFGRAFASDVVSTITITDAGKVSSITLNYTQADGSTVKTVVSYQA